MSIEAYPLSWPPGWRRTLPGRRMRARFSKGERQYSTYPDGGSWLRKSDLTVNEATQRILASLDRMGISRQSVIVSSNMLVRLDGLPRSGQRAPDDPGVCVYWTELDNSQRCMAIDLYDTVAGNLAAVAATLEAMRAIERHGGAQILNRAFQGFTALPAPGQTSGEGWREVLGFGPDANPTRREIDDKFRRLAAVHHPDKGGDSGQFHRIASARDQALQEITA